MGLLLVDAMDSISAHSEQCNDRPESVCECQKGKTQSLHSCRLSRRRPWLFRNNPPGYGGYD